MHSSEVTPRHSVIFHTLMAFVFIVSVTVFSMLANLYLADALTHDAEAINQAGSLRMQAWRLADSQQQGDGEQLRRHIQQLEATMQGNALVSSLRQHADAELVDLHASLVNRWQHVMLPALLSADQQDSYRQEVGAFVGQLNTFVHALQVSTENKLALIRALQIGLLFIIALIGFALIYGLHNNLVSPLRALTHMARRIGEGDFSTRTHIEGETELSMLAETLNQMNIELAELYQQMEAKVADKTQEVRRQNAVLELLFSTAQRLYQKPGEPATQMVPQLNRIQSLLGTGPISLCLNRPDESASYAAISSPDLSVPVYCTLPACNQCPVNVNGGQLADGTRLHSFPLRYGDSESGTLRVTLGADEQLAAWQEQLLTTLADLFAGSLRLQSLGEHQARLALMEERAIIARELHDSLAQALSAQKLQLTRLRRLLQKNAAQAEQLDTLQAIDDGLSQANRQLRELLTTFRLQVDAPGLKPALEATVSEFSRHSGLALSLDYQLDHCPLTANEEIHCLQLVREALSNVLKHARAQHCAVAAWQDKQGYVMISITDDGIGMPPGGSPEGHYGLSIMQERANSLHGELSIGTDDQPGTRILLCFKPNYRQIQLYEVRDTDD